MYWYSIFFIIMFQQLSTLQALSLKNITSKVDSYVQSVTSHFKAYKFEKITEENYAVKNPGVLYLDVKEGNIAIKSEWEKDVVYVKTIVRLQKEEDFTQLVLDVQHAPQGNKTDLFIKPYIVDPSVKVKYAIDYELIVPKKMNLTIRTGKGAISVAEVSGFLDVTTDYGSITITNARDAVVAQSLREGDIYMSNIQGSIKANTNRGNITIEHANGVINAHAKKGTVRTSHGALASNSRISLTTDMGNVIVSLPSSTPVHLVSKTEHGAIYSDHYVTLKSRTTKLDTKSWNSFKKDVDGYLGTHNSYERLAKIELRTTKGNIKILDNSITT